LQIYQLIDIIYELSSEFWCLMFRLSTGVAQALSLFFGLYAAVIKRPLTSMVFTGLFLGVFFGTFFTTPAISAALSNPNETQVAAVVATPSPSLKAATSAPVAQPAPTVTATTAAVIAPAPNCTPDTSSILPSAITPTQSGLQTVVDSPSYYSVYGNTTSQVTAQIAACTPVTSSGTNGFAGKFAAATSNSISWNVNYNVDDNDICTVSSADITLHISQVFPTWQATSGATAGLQSAWSTYSTKLYAYEQGHAQLDESGAQTLLSDLLATPTTPCSTVYAVVSAEATKDIQNTLNANTAYDVNNAFGAKENVAL
jgi:predicted secreted Zn-dependent protease